MQMYEGLPIVTNKISVEERCGIPHHLLGVIGLHSPTWTVGMFKKRATEIVWSCSEDTVNPSTDIILD